MLIKAREVADVPEEELKAWTLQGSSPTRKILRRRINRETSLQSQNLHLLR
jgi:hypothetical protein